jgi:hypothetical protein
MILSAFAASVCQAQTKSGVQLFDSQRESEQAAFPEKHLPSGRQAGAIAQEVEKVFPVAVTTEADGYKTVAYDNLVPLLIEGLKEQQAQIEALKARVSELGGKSAGGAAA